MRTYNRLVLMTFERFGRERRAAAQAAMAEVTGTPAAPAEAAAEGDGAAEGEDDDEGRPEAVRARRSLQLCACPTACAETSHLEL